MIINLHVCSCCMFKKIFKRGRFGKPIDKVLFHSGRKPIEIERNNVIGSYRLNLVFSSSEIELTIVLYLKTYVMLSANSFDCLD